MTTPDLVKAAAERACVLRHQLRAGGFCPIPLYGKEPPVKNNKRQNNRYRGLKDWEQLTEVTPEMVDMWLKVWPDSENTGVLTFNMPVLDLDILNEEAARACEDLVHERYEDAGDFLTRIGLPPKRAIPFRTDEPFKKIVVNLIAPNAGTDAKPEKIEFLGNGQQLVVAGIHPDTGKPYSWFGGELYKTRREHLPYIRELEAGAPVDELVEILVREFGYKRAPTRPKANGGGKPHDGGGAGDRDWAHLYTNVIEGRELHDSLVILAAKLIATGSNSGAVINQLRALMESSKASKDDRWRARVSEIPAAVDSAVAKYGRQPEISERGPIPAAEVEPEPELEPEPEPEPGPQPRSRRFKLKPFDTITMSTTPNYLVKGILPRVGLVVIWGPPKCGKSFKAFDLVMHVATGRKYRGRRVHQGAVVYLALEGGSGFVNRIEAWRRRHLADQPEPVPFYLLDVPTDLIADCQALISAIRAQVVGNPAVITIDTLNRAITGDENSSEDMAKFIRAADALRVAFNCLIIVIHHCGIVGNRPRGHTSLAGADDAQIAVERDKDGNVIATVEHMKDAEAGAVLASKLERLELGVDTDGDPISSCVVVPVEGGAVGLKLTKVQRFAFELLQKLIAAEGVIPPKDADLPVGFKVCRNETWRQRFYEEYPSDVKADAKRKALLRATLDLEEQKLIVLWREFAWVARGIQTNAGWFDDKIRG